MATALIAGLLGLVGTALGAVLTVWVARQSAARAERVAHENVLRQEYRAAVVKFATAVLTYRVAEIDRWHAQRGGWKDQKAATEEVYRTRSIAWEALYELELASGAGESARLAHRALNRVYSIREQEEKAEMNRRSDEVYGDLDALIAFARIAQPGKLPGSRVLPPTEVAPGREL